MIDKPAHSSLFPHPYEFVGAPIQLVRKLRRSLDVSMLEIAKDFYPGPKGYFRVVLENKNKLFFAKIVSKSRASKIRDVSSIAEFLFREKISVVLSQFEVELPEDDLVAIFYPWREHFFFRGLDMEMASLGKELANLHIALEKLSFDSEVRAADVLREALELNLEVSDEEVSRKSRTILLAWEKFERILKKDAQLIHNDLHVGNVLFNSSGEVSCILDLEEVPNSYLSPFVDLAWVIERFCLVGHEFEESLLLINNFLKSYFKNKELENYFEFLMDLGLLMQVKNLYHLSLVNRGPPSIEKVSEEKKFKYLLEKSTKWMDWIKGQSE